MSEPSHALTNYDLFSAVERLEKEHPNPNEPVGSPKVRSSSFDLAKRFRRLEFDFSFHDYRKISLQNYYS